MGAGDWILATGQVRKLNEESGRPVAVVNRMGRPQWSEVFENNPRITRQVSHGCARLLNAGGARPYIVGKTFERWTWQRWDIAPGEIYLSPRESAWAVPYGGRILVEPHTKVPGGNKSWPWDRWQALVDSRPGEFRQIGPAGTRQLNGVEFVETPTFRHACAVLAVSRAFVGAEGSLHHAAAALNVPAVVLWSHFIAPQFTGYTTQTNLRHADGWCGSRLPCEGCKRSMEAISVNEVNEGLRGIL